MLLDEIEAFVRVVEAGSFTGAAKQLGVPKSTLSRALSRLEDATRIRLLRRSTRSIALTESGRRFFEQVAPHVGGLRDAMTVLSDEDDQPQGLLRVTMPVDVAEALFADPITRFVARYPRIQIEIDASGRLVNLVEEGFDVAIRASSKLKDSSLVARKVAQTELHLFASPAYIARRGLPRTMEELAEHDVILFQTPSGRADLAGLRPDKKQPARIITSEFAFLRSLVRAGAGVGPLPSFHAVGDCADGKLVRVVPEFARASAALYVVYPQAKHTPKKVIAFRDFVVETFAKLGAGAPGVAVAVQSRARA
jgi:DNA-binding transcriptional LysR family regulator